jgi:hypothetical protein
MKTKRKGSGFKIVLIFIAVAFVGAMLLTNGILPSFVKSIPPPFDSSSELLTPNPSGNQNNLQLTTFGFKQCSGGLIALDFLIDSSGSMGTSDKMVQLQNGLREMVSEYPDSGVIGMQMFNAPDFTPPNGINELVPMSLYSSNKIQVQTAINGLIPNGFTYTKTAFEFVQPKLLAAKSIFSQYKINLVFLSDGVPETAVSDAACGNQTRCFATEQDPTSVATQIKQNGIRIFTIAYVDQSDASLNTQLQNLMKNVASSPNDYFILPDSSQIASILKQISTKICSQ